VPAGEQTFGMLDKATIANVNLFAQTA